ncbi:MAG TPA: glycosyltransferase [Cyanobacteria bacterium UBA11149]|nr:glycosyltransferase [Cyanobacteria bacterium UBA11367]HBE60166.1 glycosyltransferase [Cyanobacteria bacterium UBA11366]HBK64876.1 glycosyltransferase [Cyanobacteria bacterium UBA11166]HBR75485.1 glycosyltransferase [Cyanobacteria bacterium UBA11159]HBS70583.1 glycosyltransferase [Cyanobacteria bacterium UBA11153]HBW88775.1 glycosyltransferase [Cyanobacteria bacterium UBA11149]HCA98223.1 glycosyltransferase [Cyanobacteria bacterium UBA9226]
MKHNFPQWICCQLGAREHYAIPRTLHQEGQLDRLITDAWVLPQSLLNRLPKPFLSHLRDRYHPDLAEASVQNFTSSLLRFELDQHLKKKWGWERIIARNEWFQTQAIWLLERITPKLNHTPIIFAYSYAALEIFRYAKNRNWHIILGQIDPGFLHDKIVLDEHSKYPNYQSNWQAAPSDYWTNWQEECSLADRIIVNSLWSSQALQKAGISASKIALIPLVYTPPETSRDFVRSYPSVFSRERPLRVLFLGKINLAKGIAALLDAAKLLYNQPIEFWLVGSQSIPKPQDHQGDNRIHWIDSVPRSATGKYYQEADVFIFPTLSDGFGLTQLEAQAWKLPIIASRFCGEVVKDGVNGLILPEVTGFAIALALEFCLNNPQSLQNFSSATSQTSQFKLSHLYHHLQSLSHALI